MILIIYFYRSDIIVTLSEGYLAIYRILSNIVYFEINKAITILFLGLAVINVSNFTVGWSAANKIRATFQWIGIKIYRKVSKNIESVCKKINNGPLREGWSKS